MKEQHDDTYQDLEESWTDHSATIQFRAKGFVISAKMEMKDKEIIVMGDIPWIALPFKSQIEDELVKRLKDILA
jgi:hypothetical protein